MTREQFIKNYNECSARAVEWAEKSRREGLLALDDEIDPEKAKARDIFEYGMRFVVDGTDSGLIAKLLSNIIAQEKDEYTRILKNVQKEAVLAIQQGIYPRMISAMLNSYTDLSLAEDETWKSMDN